MEGDWRSTGSRKTRVEMLETYGIQRSEQHGYRSEVATWGWPSTAEEDARRMEAWAVYCVDRGLELAACEAVGYFLQSVSGECRTTWDDPGWKQVGS